MRAWFRLPNLEIPEAEADAEADAGSPRSDSPTVHPLLVLDGVLGQSACPVRIRGDTRTEYAPYRKKGSSLFFTWEGAGVSSGRALREPETLRNRWVAFAVRGQGVPAEHGTRVPDKRCACKLDAAGGRLQAGRLRQVTDLQPTPRANVGCRRNGTEAGEAA